MYILILFISLKNNFKMFNKNFKGSYMVHACARGISYVGSNTMGIPLSAKKRKKSLLFPASLLIRTS